MINQRYELVVFDWEGTLSDTSTFVLTLLAKEANRLHFGALDEHLARQSVSLGLTTMIKRCFPLLALTQQEMLLEAMQQTLSKCSLDESLIPGAETIVHAIHACGIQLAIATNRGKQALQRALTASGLAPYFTVTRTASDAPAKPCPQMLEDILAYSGVIAEKALMIGDSRTDIEMAVSIGVDAIGVNFYFQQDQKNELLASGASAVFDNYQMVADYLGLSGQRC